jgi:AraC family transcriptional regulator of adaptative response / DNA-3-methyladenine glycosylase II
LGVSPLQYLQTRRLLTAKQLLADTDLPVTQVALASGFASVRRFNAAFVAALRPQPHAAAPQRRAASRRREAAARCAWLPAAATMCRAAGVFASGASLPGWNGCRPQEATCLRRTCACSSTQRGLRLRQTTGWLQCPFDEAAPPGAAANQRQPAPVLPLVIRRVRAMLDLDADPAAINAVLHGALSHGDGLRVPGALDGFELAVRAVLGQQITVAAARTLGQRLVERFGEPIDTPWPELHRLFPTQPAVLARAEATRWASWASCASARRPSWRWRAR